MIRIIAGKFRGRRLPVPPGKKVRPTSDRVKTAVFNILGTACTDAQVLDLYAGAGGIGFEALSRGADHVTFVDNVPHNIDHLRDTAKTLHVEDAVTCIVSSAEKIADKCTTGPFDIMYADPPYAQADPERILTVLDAPSISRAGTLCIIECSARCAKSVDTVHWKHIDHRHYGKTHVLFYMRNDTETQERNNE